MPGQRSAAIGSKTIGIRLALDRTLFQNSPQGGTGRADKSSRLWMRLAPRDQTGRRAMRYRGLDLNLLVALDALLRTQSVSLAAKSVNVTQPAMSAALARLRLYFDDRLLITRNGRTTLTPVAQTLTGSVAETLRGIDASIIAPPVFDPSRSKREFRLLAADTVIAGLLAKPLEHVARRAPHLRLDIVTPHGVVSGALDEGRVDLLVVPQEYSSPHHPQELLLEEDHCIIACARTWRRSGVTLEQYAAADHVEVYVGAGKHPYLPAQLFAKNGISRRIAVKLDQFSLVPLFLRGTKRLATFPGMTAELFAGAVDLKFLPLPFDLPSVRLVMQWHSHADRDPGLAWLRDSLKRHLPTSQAGHKSRLYRLLQETI
jgi:LysR family nod box-dependent transcriptional activator